MMNIFDGSTKMLLINFRWNSERCTVNNTSNSLTPRVNSSHNVSMETRSLWLTLPSLFCSVCVADDGSGTPVQDEHHGSDDEEVTSDRHHSEVKQGTTFFGV